MIEIKHRINGKVLYTAENTSDVREVVEEAVKAEADLCSADLRSANLRYANLRSANLCSADLRSADLRSADLRSANLRYANLRSANLCSADLRSANLRYADLRYADLRYADLCSADLRSANLRSADLRYADLRSADLRSADLRSADLRSANPGWRHPLWIFQQDFFSILDQAPGEVAAVREAMVEGRIDGSVYSQDGCGCLTGTIAIKRGCNIGDLERQTGIVPDSGRPAEQWFIAIKKGDKPIPIEKGTEFETESVFRTSVALAWLDEYIASRKRVGAVLGAAE